MLSTAEMEKWLDYLDAKVAIYSARPEIQCAIIGAMAEMQRAIVDTKQYEESHATPPLMVKKQHPLSQDHPQVNWTPEPRK